MPSRFPAAVFAFVLLAAPALAQWTQWGGPRRDFTCDAKGLLEKFPEAGPQKLWQRPLGPGYSTIVVDDGCLYTMYRDDSAGNEVVACLEANTGKTVWESKYPIEVPQEHIRDFGSGPRSTPLVAGDKLITASLTGRLVCWDKKSGKELWAQELVTKLDGTPLMHGYTTSPMLYKDKVITFVGGDGRAVMAFDLATGRIAWGIGDFANSQSSPILINVDGQDQIVAFMADQVAGVTADGSAVLWSHKHKNQWSTNIPTPLWTEGNVLLISSEGTSGTRALKLSRDGDQTKVQEVWHSAAFRINHGNAVRVGDCYVGSVGGGASFVMCVDAKSGEVKWKERGFKLAKFLQADGKLLLFDEDGVLAIVRATPEKLEVLAKAPLFTESRTWTTPTLADGRLYARDDKNIAAFDLRPGSDRSTQAEAGNGMDVAATER